MKPTTPIHQTWHWDFYQIKLLYSQSSKNLLKIRGRRPYRLVHSIIPDPTDPVALGLFSDRLPVCEGIYVELYY